MSSSGKLLDLVQKAASAVTMTSSSDLSEMQNLQELLDQISACVEEVGQMPDELKHQAKDATDSASSVIASLLKEDIKDAEQSIKTVSDTIVTLQSLAEQISQTVTEQAASEQAADDTQSQGQQDIAEEQQESQAESDTGGSNEYEEHVIDEDDLPLVMDFITEAAEHIENAEAGLLEVETKPDDAEAINLIFRGFHTVKGMAGFLNLVQIGSLAHAAENLLDLGRKGEIRFEGENMNVIFESVDMLKNMMEQLQSAVNSDCILRSFDGLDSLLVKLKACAEGNAAAADQEEPQGQDSAQEAEAEQEVQQEAQTESEPFAEAQAKEKPQTDQSEDVKKTQAVEEEKVSAEQNTDVEEKAEDKTACDTDKPAENKAGNDTKVEASQGGTEVEEKKPEEKPQPATEEAKPAAEAKQPEPKQETSSKPQAAAKPQTADEPKAAVKPQAEPKPKPGASAAANKPAVANTPNKPKAAVSDEKIKVSTSRLDDLVNMVGELVIAQSMVMQATNKALSPEHELCNKVGHQGKIVRELQELSMTLRMVPIQGVFQKMARLVRDLSQKSGKKVEFVTEGEETELDRIVVDQIADPLVHMIRNSVDHGIESAEERAAAGKPEKGTVHLRAFHQAGSIVIEIMDDGKGLDKDKILKKAMDNGIVQPGQELSDQDIYKLIFSAGLSTAAKVTDVSGRGVGMDVVKKNIESLRGKIEINSTIGKGTTFAIKLPLTMAIIDGQVVRVGSQRYIIPIVSIECCVKPSESQISTVAGKGEMAMVQGQLIPMVRLYKMFGVKPDTENAHESSLVVVEEDGKKGGLVVDELLGQHQVVIKSLGAALGRIKGVSGGAIMGDGKVNLILDIPGLLEASKE